MATLAKRATPRQQLVMRMVAGAVMNAGHAHPAWKISPVMARSIAKRATGTLTANWPDVLAAPRALSESAASQSLTGGATSGTHVNATGGGRASTRVRAPLAVLHGAIGSMAAEAKRTHQHDRAEALIDVLRLIAREMAG